MPNATHLYTVMRGTRTNTALQGETWQSGLRFALDLGVGTLDSVGTFPSGLSVEPVERAETNIDSYEANFRISKAGYDFDPVDFLKDQLAPAYTGIIRKSGAAISATVQLNEIAIYAVGADGRVVQTDLGPAKGVYQFATTIKGTATGDPLPPFVCSAISLYTDNKTRKGRGRMYSPCLATSAVGPDGEVSSTVRTALATGYRDAIVALTRNSAVEASNQRWFPIVASPTGQKYFEINEVRVGSMFDTQRRRKGQITESYTKLGK